MSVTRRKDRKCIFTTSAYLISIHSVHKTIRPADNPNRNASATLAKNLSEFVNKRKGAMTVFRPADFVFHFPSEDFRLDIFSSRTYILAHAKFRLEFVRTYDICR